MAVNDEWTMICPPGSMTEAEILAEVRPENIREIIESPVATDKFILVNDSQQERFWADLAAMPVRFYPPVAVPFIPIVNDPAALITGLPGI